MLSWTTERRVSILVGLVKKKAFKCAKPICKTKIPSITFFDLKCAF